MALESATYVNQLVSTNPSGSDSISQGDDHLKLIKTVLKTSFPDVVGQASATIITAASAPTSNVRGTIWYDTGNNLLKVNTAVTGASATWASIANTGGFRSFSATKGGTNQTGIATGTLTKVTWPTVDWDTGGCFAEGSDSGPTVATSRFICNVAGKYHFYFALKLTGNVEFDNMVALYKNGALVRYANYFIAYDSGANTGVPTMQLEASLNLDVPDYVEVYVHQESGEDQVVDGGATATWFNGHKIE